MIKQYKIVAGDSIILDQFEDEPILVSNNVTALFDVGMIPSDFTRQIVLPATKRNEDFFGQYWDISVESPFLFATNIKVPARIDFDGLFVADGYIQLNKVVVNSRMEVEQYEVTIYGSVSNLGREINRKFLTDLQTLSQYNYTASYTNVTGSWDGTLFNGNIVIPWVDYGQRYSFDRNENIYTVNTPSGSVSMLDYKPAIRLKRVWDAIFTEASCSYTSNFFAQSWLNDVYVLCDNGLKYVKTTSDDNWDTYGTFRISGKTSGSAAFSVPSATETLLPFYNIEQSDNHLAGDLAYTVDVPTELLGEIRLNVGITKTAGGNGIPNFTLVIRGTGLNVKEVPLEKINAFFNEVRASDISQGISTATATYKVAQQYNSLRLTPDTYKFYIKWVAQGPTNFTVVINPDESPYSTLSVTKVKNAIDGKVIDIPKNMPYGTTGIKQVDFIQSVQKKFNLVIYPDKKRSNNFIVETFNRWYKTGDIVDIGPWIDLEKGLEVVPANELAVNQLNFGDTLDLDWYSQQFAKTNNREYGKTYYLDTENFFSQGSLDVKTRFASVPLAYVPGTGVSGSATAVYGVYTLSVKVEYISQTTEYCFGSPTIKRNYRLTGTLLDTLGVPTINFGTGILIDVRFYKIGTTTPGGIENILIPNGAKTGTTDFEVWTLGNPCGNEAIDPNTGCILSFTGGSGTISIDPGSPIIAC